MQKLLTLILLLAFSSICICKFPFLNKANAEGSHWAVLVAGPNGFWNYRHQSDVFHSYHILVENGVPKENIIVLAYDDIANDYENPFKGKVYNRPDPKGEGRDVYAGVQIDYTGEDVTPQNFLAVLRGDKTQVRGGSGRVLETTENDNVFVYFSDHGATGLIAFPSSELYADDLNKTLNLMSKNRRFRELVFYLEACESGSMFNNILANNIKVYTTTAANPNQSSWATYCSPDDVVNGKSVGSCLGDEYSVNWMEDSDSNEGLTETLQNQFEVVRVSTKNSEAHQYGDLSFVNNPIGDFQGNSNSKGIFSYTSKLVKKVRKFFKKIYYRIKNKNSDKKAARKEYRQYLKLAKESKVNSRDAKLRYLYEKAQKKNDLKSQQQYLDELHHIDTADSIFNTFNESFYLTSEPIVEKINFECLKPAVEAYKNICQWGEYDLKYVRNIAHACERGASVSDIKKMFEKICQV